REQGERQYGVAVPWVEYEKDQKAYYSLLGILDTLAAVPTNRLPLTPQGALDVIGALRLALDGQTYQIKTEDDAGVQVFEMRELRGLRFRHVYVLGLIDGQIPRLPEEGLLARRRRRTSALAEQLAQKETEAAYLFTQLFEAAEERLVLACPNFCGSQKNLPSRFLVAVQDQVELALLQPPNLTAGMREAAIQLGRAAGQEDKETRRQGDKELEEAAAALANWRIRAPGSSRIQIDHGRLLELLFSET